MSVLSETNCHDTAVLHNGNGEHSVTADEHLSLESVITTSELSRRSSRLPDYEAENRALVCLAEKMATSPRSVLQQLVETALKLCQAHSAGISILEEENGRKIFRWHAVAGQWSGYLGGTMPREISPCGTVLDRNAIQLMEHPERHFPFPPEVAPSVVEVLLIPFHVAQKPVGTIWVIAHDESRQFDAEDARIMQNLGKFASSAYQILASLDAVNVQVAERNHVEETLRESERQFREMIDALPVAIYTTDAEGRLTHYNRAAVEFSGRTPELGTDHWCVSWKLYHADGTPLPHDKCPMAIALKEGRAVRGVEAIAERPDGKRIWFMPFPTPLRDAEGKIVGGINMLLDITERKRAEQAGAWLSAIVDSSDDAIISKDLNGIIASWNKTAERIFGYTAQEVIGQPVTILIPRDRLSEEPHILDQIKRGERVDHYETLRVRKDGSPINISLTISPVKDSAGRIVGVSKIARDITDRKHAEASLRAAHDLLSDRAKQLEQLVQERTAKLRETITELESFSYSITHDMRAPLRAMQRYASLVQEQSAAQLSPEAGEYLARIMASAGRLDQLITDVLSYSQVARSELKVSVVDVDRLLRDILTSYTAFQAPDAHISIDGKLPPVLGNEAALTQCISNLLSNAVKFVRPSLPPHVRIFHTQDDSRVSICFEDHGIGIDPESHQRIFGIFQRESAKYEGTGIGLAIVKKAVERMGGTVSLISELGKGSTFCLHLRRADT
jgi:PAS domain S-box-containing protein